MANNELTAVDYIAEQLALEREAKEVMPFDPNECTYTKGPIRQMVYACLTCGTEKSPVGVCYSCLIRCHSTHELVELFSKRSFVCDCGTTRILNSTTGGCTVRAHTEETPSQEHTFRPRSGSIDLGGRNGFRPPASIPADDIPSSSNRYNQNYCGKFCSCKKLYNPLEETGTMIQCYLGTECGEDWYHLRCVVGLSETENENANKSTGNILDSLNDAGQDAHSDVKKSNEADNNLDESNATDEDDDEDDNELLKIPHFPSLGSFDQFICWKCVNQYRTVFDALRTIDGIVHLALPHFEELELIDEWTKAYDTKWTVKLEQDSEPRVKRIKKETIPYSLFLQNSFRDPLIAYKQTLDSSHQVYQFLESHSYLYVADPVYEPPKDDDSSSSTGSLLDLGTDVLLSLPREQAVEGLQAYNMIKAKLRDFFKPFAEQGKVVTEEEVRDFFSKVKKN